MINIVAAVGKNLELGKNGKLIWYLPNDLKYFKKITSYNTVVMGRVTFESIGKALPNRKNIVITSDNLDVKDINIVHDYKELLNLDEDLFIIGGESIYKLFLPHADYLYLTEIDSEDKYADTFFPYFDKSLYDKKIIKNESYNGIDYRYVIYRKK